MVDPITGVVVLVCGMVGLWLIAIAFSINLMFWGGLMQKIKNGLLEYHLIKAVLYSVAVVASFATGSAISLCLIIPAAEMLGWM